MAKKIREACTKAGYPFFMENKTNQIFVVLPNDKMHKLEEKYVFAHWQKMDEDHWGIRICTSWATKEEDVDNLISDILEG